MQLPSAKSTLRKCNKVKCGNVFLGQATYSSLKMFNFYKWKCTCVFCTDFFIHNDLKNAMTVASSIFLKGMPKKMRRVLRSFIYLLITCTFHKLFHFLRKPDQKLQFVSNLVSYANRQASLLHNSLKPFSILFH